MRITIELSEEAAQVLKRDAEAGNWPTLGKLASDMLEGALVHDEREEREADAEEA